MARTTFDGPVVSKNGFQGTGPAMTRTIAAGAQTIVNTLTVPAVATEVLATDVAGKVFVKSDAAATTITLPKLLTQQKNLLVLHQQEMSLHKLM